MVWFFSMGALLCMIYYVVILVYSGVTTSWCSLWLIAAAMFLLLAFGAEYYIRHSKKIPLWVPVSVLTTLFAGAAVFAVTLVLIFGTAAVKDVPDMDYVIVLGTQVKGEKISDSLKRRLDKVLVYAEENPDTVFVLSGGRGKGEYMPEAEAMYVYLRYNGVPERNMMKEEFSTNTKENMEYSRTLIEQAEAGRREREERVPKVAVLSSDFHVFRAKQIAKKMGFTEIHSIRASSNPVLFLHFCVREVLAVFKDKLLGNM